MQIQPLTNPELPNFDLVPLKSEDKPYRSYQLPGESWGLAYEPVLGRIAVTNDQAGVLIYKVDDLLEGKYSPQVIAVNGIPSGVCFKNFQTQPKFIVSKINSPSLDVIDSNTLARNESIRLTGPSGIATITGSPWVRDPYLYCIATSSIGKAFANDDWGGRLLRLDLADKQVRLPRERFVNMVPTEDGTALLGTRQGWVESCLLRFENAEDSPQLHTEFLYGDSNELGSGKFTNDFDLAINRGVSRDSSFFVHLGERTQGCQNTICVHSTTKPFESKFVKIDAFRPPKNKVELAELALSTSLSSGDVGRCEAWATDDERKLFLLVKNDVLVVLLLKDLGLGKLPPNLIPRQRIPRVANIGEKFQYGFGGLPSGTKVEFLAENSTLHVNTHSKNGTEHIFKNKDGSGLNNGIPVILKDEFRWIPIPQQAGWNRLHDDCRTGSFCCFF